MKTAIEQVREALESAHHHFQNILDYGVAQGSDRDKVRAEQDILRAALTALKSLEGQEVVAWMSDSGKVVSADGKLHMEEAEHPVGIHYDIPLVRLTKSANP